MKKEEQEEIYNLEGQSVQKVIMIPQNIDQRSREQKTPLYRLQIDKVDALTVMKSETDIFSVKVFDQQTKQQWTINRRYSQFEWLFRVTVQLFKALKTVSPGETFPYFPSITVQAYLVKKLYFIDTDTKTKYLANHVQELNDFIVEVSRHQVFGHSQEIKIFVNQNTEEFRRMKKNIDRQIEELNNTESTSITLLSIFERGIAWISDTALGEVLEQNQAWNKIKSQQIVYSQQLLILLQKFYDLSIAKGKEISWEGPETQIDSVQILKVKIRSGQQYNQLLINQIQLKILHPLFQECKKQGQIEQQLNQKQDLERLIKYLKKYTGNEARIQKLMRRKQAFDRNFKQCFIKIQQQWRQLATDIDNKFRKIWSQYCRNMLKIWK